MIADAESPAMDAPVNQRLIHARLVTLLRLALASGDLAYPREVDLTGVHRRLLSLVGLYAPVTSMELVALTGLEKAQISRAVNGLHALHLIDRPSRRGGITLAPAGRALLDQVLGIAVARDAALLGGIEAAARQRFAEMTSRLVARAAAMLRRERQLTDGAADQPISVAEPMAMPSYVGSTDERITLVLPAVVALVSYMRRSATLIYKRETGISSFDWQMLSQLGQQDPQTLAQLVQASGRDKSQIGRAVQRLVEAGLVSRHKVEGRRDILLGMTGKGRQAYKLIHEGAIRRDKELLEDLTPAERNEYARIVERLIANAAALLDEEREHGG